MCFGAKRGYQEGVAAVSAGDSGSGRLGVGTGRARMNGAQIYYPLTGRRQTDTESWHTSES